MRKYGVELFRFIMSIIVCLHHFRLYSDALPYGGGYLAVDFFFILSGYFLYMHGKRNEKNNERKPLKQTVQYAWGRYKRLYTQYIVVFFIYIVVYLGVWGISWGRKYTSSFVLKMLMLDAIYVREQSSIMPQGWYCSSLLVASAVIYYLFARFGKKFMRYIMPVLSIGIYVILFFRYGYLNLYSQHGFGLTVGTFRAVAGLGSGWVLADLIGKHPAMYLRAKWIQPVCFLTITGGVLYALLWDNGYSKSDFILPVAFMLMLYYLLKDNVISAFLDKPLFSMAGKMSYMLFLIHYLIAVLFDSFSWMRNVDWKITSLAYVVIVTVVSFFLYNIVIKIWALKVRGTQGYKDERKNIQR